MILSDTLDKIGGPKHKNAQARNNVISHPNILKLEDVFQLKYPLAKSFIKKQINPFTATRLDFFLVSEHLCDRVRETENLYYCYRCSSSSTRTWFLET